MKKKEIQLLKNNALATEEWSIMQLPLGENNFFRYEEPNAILTPIDNGIEIRVDHYTKKGLPNMQQTDTCKHFYMSNSKIQVPQSGKIKLAVDMAAQSLGIDGQNYQDAFAFFNVFDEANALIYDHLSTENRALSIYEKLIIPGFVDPKDAFTYFVEAPYIKAPAPLEWHNHSIVLDLDQNKAIWYFDEFKIFEIDHLQAKPEYIRIGFGLFTFKPYINGESVSIQGQGMLGRWKNLTIEIQN